MNEFWTNILRYPRFFISSLIGLIDNYILAKKEIIERNNEIRDLKCELAKISSEQMDFNNFSLVKHKDKQVKELQQEISILKKQLGKYTSATNGSSSPKSSIPSIPIAEITENSKPAVELSTETKPSVRIESKCENAEVPYEPKKRGRKNVQKPKEEMINVKPDEVDVNSKTTTKKTSRKKKNDPVIVTIGEQELLETKATPSPKLETEEVIPEVIPEVILEVIPEVIQPESIISKANEENVDEAYIPETKLYAEDDCKIVSELPKTTKVIDNITLSYDEPISINEQIAEQIPELPEDTEDLDVITIDKTKYWLYNNLLYEFININKVGNFIRKYN